MALHETTHHTNIDRPWNRRITSPSFTTHPQGVNSGWNSTAQGNGDGPTWQPDTQNPQWSRRATLMLEVLRTELDLTKVDLIWTDRHILDPEFADLVMAQIRPMIAGTWQPIGQCERA